MNTITIQEARADYYRVNGFGDDGGDSLDWVPLKIWRFTIKIPNTSSRRKALKIHDLHHVVTGYATNLRGESEIAAWELASGCRRMPAAFVLNVFALAIGAIIAPRAVLRAWARGRVTTNLYSHDTVDSLLPLDVATVRANLGLDAPVPAPRFADIATFAPAALLAVLLLVGVIAGPLVGLFVGISALANAIA
ncbi:MAG: hypothetical protein AB7T06_09535 [Kofleriaceae bacterium]